MNHLLPRYPVTVIIPAAGSGERLGALVPKALVPLVGRTLVEHAVANLSPIASQIIIAAPAGFEEQFSALFGESITVVTGGATRSESVKKALAVTDPQSLYVLVHDAARSLASTDLAVRVIEELVAGEVAVIPGLAVVDTTKEVDESGYVLRTPDRAFLRAVQTPQGFAKDQLIAAHETHFDATDDAGLMELAGHRVKIIDGEERALKITTQQDLATAARILLPDGQSDIRIGIGSDAHAFSTDELRPMWLAGLHWPEVIGVDGHSDGDVAAHAICDALFAATSLGDLGSNFGVAEPEYASASGQRLLKETLHRITEAGFRILNISVQIVGNKPKIGPRRSEAIAALSHSLGGASVSVSATTTDGLGFTGEGKGISAIASALVYRI